MLTPIIEGLPGGWTLGYVFAPNQNTMYPEAPAFRMGSGVLSTQLRTPFQVARLEEGRAIFFEVKRWLDAADSRLGRFVGQDPAWRAMEKCKLAMEIELKKSGAWQDELKQNDVELNRDQIIEVNS